MSETAIEWAQHSLNPIRATMDLNAKRSGHYCEKISAGCKFCYSSRQQPRFGMPQFQEQRGERGPCLFLDEKILRQPLRRRTPTVYFWCSMTDMLGSWVPLQFVDACFAVMAMTPQHTHIVLTKRAERLRTYSTDQSTARSDSRGRELHKLGGAHLMEGSVPWPLPNVWLGVSVENQKAADERIPLLLQTPAAVRFLSVEPLLEAVSFDSVCDGLNPLYRWERCGASEDCSMWREDAEWTRSMTGCRHSYADAVRHREKIDWVIVGGESGPTARPCDIGWIRKIVEECAEAKVPCFVKQLGARSGYRPENGCPLPGADCEALIDDGRGWFLYDLLDRKGGDIDEFPIDLRVREFPEVHS